MRQLTFVQSLGTTLLADNDVQIPQLGGDTITESLVSKAPGLLNGIEVYCVTVPTTAGTFTLDVKVDGVTVLSTPFDLTSISALPAIEVLVLSAAPVALLDGSVVQVISASDDVDLALGGLRVRLLTGAN